MARPDPVATLQNATPTGRSAMALPWLLGLVVPLLVIDVAFIGIHLSHLYGPGPGYWRWDLGVDMGFSEMFQYLKEIVVAVIMLIMFVRSRHLILLAWSYVFAFLALDDALQGHEKVGGRIARGLDISDWDSSLFGTVRGQDFGELAAALLFLVPMLVALFIGWLKATPELRRFTLRLGFLAALLAGFGVALDFVVNAVDTEWIFLLEDGSEMFVVSVIVWFVVRVFLKNDHDEPIRPRET